MFGLRKHIYVNICFQRANSTLNLYPEMDESKIQNMFAFPFIDCVLHRTVNQKHRKRINISIRVLWSVGRTEHPNGHHTAVINCVT